MSNQPKVQFNSLVEFRSELAQWPKETWLDGALRATKTFTRNRETGGAIQHVQVAAGLAVKTGGRMQVIEFTTYCGDIWTEQQDDPTAKRTLERADKILDELEAAAKELGLRWAAGRYT